MRQQRRIQLMASARNRQSQQNDEEAQQTTESADSVGLPPQYQEQIQQYSNSPASRKPMIAKQGGLEASHRTEASRHLSVTGRKFFDLIEFDEQEDLVLEIRKHPFGLFFIWAIGIIVTIILLFVPVAIAAFLSSSSSITGVGNTAAIQSILLIIGIVLGIAGIGVTIINTVLYKNNVIYITSEKIAQVVYLSLFNRKISQLSIGDLQDVTVRQNGIFPRAFNFGTLTIETSGEQQNYEFNYVPAPYESAKMIVGAHEENLKQYGN
ncbi:MAG: hypothetical protein M3Q79_02345 [bacterium]|nr:hypothetical protein [bacterium]